MADNPDKQKPEATAAAGLRINVGSTLPVRLPRSPVINPGPVSAHYRKYLQQHHRQVFVTGKHYLLVTGVCAPAE